MKKKWIFLVFLFFYQIQLFSQQNITKIVYYNLLNFNGSKKIDYLRTILNYIKPDILVVTELASIAGCDSVLSILGSNYSRAAFVDGKDSDNMIYFKRKFILHSQDTILTELRLINEYVLYYDTIYPNKDTIFLRFYAAHLKASSGNLNMQKRYSEVKNLINHVKKLQQPENIFFGGDMNFYSSSEPAYQELIKNNLNDPLGNIWANAWHNNYDHAHIHTQSTRVRQFGGGATGGMNDRFDFIFISNDIITGENNVHFTGYYKAIGNDGKHFNDSINALPNYDVPENVANALHYMSDHLPVMIIVGLSFPDNAIIKGDSIKRILK